MSSAQYWTSRVKMGERLVESEYGTAYVIMGVLNESAVIRQLIRSTAKSESE
jgi:hypothetical protein